MKTLSAFAVALSLISAVALSPAANAATTNKAVKPASTTACMTKDKKPCVKQVAKKPVHKHKVMAKSTVKPVATTKTKKAG